MPASIFGFSSVTYTLGEAGRFLTVTVNRVGFGSGEVDYATSNGTATAGTDYTAANGRLTFSASQKSKSFTVPVLNDNLAEGDETFTLTLTAVNNTDLINPSRGEATATIVDNDAAGLSIADVSRAEGQAGSTAFTFTVGLSGPSVQTVTMEYATADGTATAAGGDYVTATGTLTFAPGETAKAVTVTVLGDQAVEPDETFFVNLSNPINASMTDGQGLGTILDDDAPVAVPDAYTVSEDATLMETAPGVLDNDTNPQGGLFTAVLVSGPSHGMLTLNPDGSFTYTPAANYNGSDSFAYTANDETVASNVATASFTVTAVNDAPLLSGGTAALPPVPEAETDPPGASVGFLLGPLFSDPDGDTLAGIAVVGDPQNGAQGAWQYSTDGGAAWLDADAVGEESALVLSAETLVRFRPALGFSGDPVPLAVRTIDSSYTGSFTAGAAQVTADTTTAGGVTPFSAATTTVQGPVSDESGVWFADGNLFVTGTAGDDRILVRPVAPGRVAVVLNGQALGVFQRADLTGRIRVRGVGGNDLIRILVATGTPADLYGGAGNDTLRGAKGSDRLFGEAGNDRLYGLGGDDMLVSGEGNDILGGGRGQDVLIGGGGPDFLQGSLGSDLLIGGATDFDLNATALAAIGSEWGSSSGYADRVAHLTGSPGGLNGGIFLIAATVHDDAAPDTLRGYFGLDWFWTGASDMFALGAGEQSSASG